MSTKDHDRYRDDVGVYLLGALADTEAQAFEAHLRTCQICRDELEHLTLAANALPQSATQLDPPPRLKAEIMAVVDADAGTASKHRLRPRGLAALTQWRPRAAWAVAATVVAIAVASGFGIAQLLADEDAPRTVAAKIDHGQLGDATAKLTIDGDGQDGGTLRVAGFPQPRPGRTYMAWVARGTEMSPQPTFDVDANGSGAVAIPTDLRDIDAVLVTREPQGGSPVPSQTPVVRVDL